MISGLRPTTSWVAVHSLVLGNQNTVYNSNQLRSFPIQYLGTLLALVVSYTWLSYPSTVEVLQLLPIDIYSQLYKERQRSCIR
jgi:hypothetical protein